MPNGSPPARRRTTGDPPSANRPRRTGSSLRASGGRAKLVCTAGPMSGEEFALSGDEVVVGRAADNAVSIPDTSVSRKHVLLRRVPSGWAASDMGSGNGTLVNGEPIVEETVLRSGDLISIGDTELSFVDEEQGTDRRPLPVRRSGDLPARSRPVVRSSRASRSMRAVDPNAARKRKKVLLAAASALALVVIVLVGIKALQFRADRQRLAKEGEAQAMRAQVGAMFQEGKNLVREGRWIEAKAKFEEIALVNPSYPPLQEYLARAEKEIPNQQQLAAAAEALEKNQLGSARAALDKVSADTVQFQQLRDLKNRLEEKLSSRIAEARRLLDAEGTRDLERMRQLDEMTQDILAAFPDSRDAAELSKQAKAALGELTRPAPTVAKEGPKPWLDVAARFKDGDVSGAFSLANDCAAKKVPQCKALVSQISEFQEKYRRLENLSAKELSDLLDLDERITGGQRSSMARNIGTRMSGLFYKSASSAKAAGDWGRAMDFARKTLRADPGHAGAQAILAEARGKAKDLFLQGYALKETNPEDAVKMFKEVMAMTPRDDETHQKAKSWVERLEK